MENKHCKKCGAELLEDQKFCTGCGEPVDSPIGIKPHNKKINKIILLIAAVAIVITGIFVFVYLKLGSFKGKYIYINTDGETNRIEYYEFFDNYYIYNVGNKTIKGTYEVEKDRIILTDDSNNHMVLFRDGKYIFLSDLFYPERIGDGETISQTLTHDVKTEEDEEKTYETIDQVPDGTYEKISLKSDGRYSWTTTTVTSIKTKCEYTFGWRRYEYDCYKPETTTDVELGTYSRNKNEIILKPQGEDFSRTYIVKDGLVYYSVFKKE